jgi:hypothetical protein
MVNAIISNIVYVMPCVGFSHLIELHGIWLQVSKSKPTLFKLLTSRATQADLTQLIMQIKRITRRALLQMLQ